jgi:uncharacterized repeat protein (TIGR03803 family)
MEDLMRSKRSLGLTVVLAISIVILFTTGTRAAAQTETVLHNFDDNGTDGYQSYAGLISDASGNLYGTTTRGGTNLKCYSENIGCGTVFELSPAAGGGWTESILHDFNNNGTDGFEPLAAMVFDASGNLYGTTQGGGSGTGCGGGSLGCGTAFELTPATGGWTEKVLYSFGRTSTDGYYPGGSLVFDAAGNLFGTTFQGGAHGYGTVFELAARAGGAWAEGVLHSFSSEDGSSPVSGLIFDAAGNLYGTTRSGGGHTQGGTVFELMPKVGGGWTRKVLHAFRGLDGSGPVASLVLNGGNLYGTTEAGGAGTGCGLGDGCGTVFELAPAAGGNWTETVLHSFADNGTDGYEPLAGLVSDGAGNLYGTTFRGGAGVGSCGGCGTVFELSPKLGGGWTETLLHGFQSSATDGYWPASSLIRDAAGNLFGTSVNGGVNTDQVCGTVFEITP